MEIKDRIRKFREKKGLSTTDLSKLTGISQSTISKIENGKRKINFEILEIIAEALDISVDRLTGESASSIIEDRLEEIGKTLEEVAQKTGVSLHWLKNLDTFIPGEWANGELEYHWITKVAKEIGLPGSQLRAALARQEIPVYDGPTTSSPEEDFEFITPEQAFGEPGVTLTPISSPTKIIRIPVLGSIPAGAAIEAVENILEWEDIPEEWTYGGRQYFGLLVRGDSMYPEYLDGDTVIIRKQPCCDSGDDCAVIINAADATLKRVHILEEGIELEAINPMYGRKKYTNQEVENLPVTILGVVVELRRKKK